MFARLKETTVMAYQRLNRGINMSNKNVGAREKLQPVKGEKHYLKAAPGTNNLFLQHSGLDVVDPLTGDRLWIREDKGCEGGVCADIIYDTRRKSKNVPLEGFYFHVHIRGDDQIPVNGAPGSSFLGMIDETGYNGVDGTDENILETLETVRQLISNEEFMERVVDRKELIKSSHPR